VLRRRPERPSLETHVLLNPQERIYLPPRLCLFLTGIVRLFIFGKPPSESHRTRKSSVRNALQRLPQSEKARPGESAP